MKKPIVVETDFHRNGICGEGFRVSIVEDGEHGRMLVVDFNPDFERGKVENYDQTYGYTAVLNLDKAAEGNIYMFPDNRRPGTGNNAWRGDVLGDVYRPLIRAMADAKYEAQSARWKSELEQRKAEG